MSGMGPANIRGVAHRAAEAADHSLAEVRAAYHIQAAAEAEDVRTPLAAAVASGEFRRCSQPEPMQTPTTAQTAKASLIPPMPDEASLYARSHASRTIKWLNGCRKIQVAC